MKVAVCIVTFRNVDDVRACLAALERSTHADFEVVICENGGPDAFARLRAALPERLGSGQAARLIDAGGNVGYAGGVNRAISAAPDADAWWVLNPDTQARPDALSRMVARLQEGDVAAVGSVVAGDDGRVQSLGGRWRKPMARPEALGSGMPLGSAERAGVEATQDYISGASMLVGRRFVETVGLMREDYFLYCEEVEWCLRAKAAGLRLGFAPDAVVIHDAGSTTGSGAAMQQRPKLPVYLNHRNQILLTRDLFPAWTPVAAVGMLAVFALRYARRGAWRQLGYALQGWAAGLKGERGPPAWAQV